MHIEAGHTAQNLCLQATALDLGTVTVGVFRDDQVKKILNLPGDEQPLYLMPVGKRRLKMGCAEIRSPKKSRYEGRHELWRA